jgi:hypothetical protein
MPLAATAAERPGTLKLRIVFLASSNAADRTPQRTQS